MNILIHSSLESSIYKFLRREDRQIHSSSAVVLDLNFSGKVNGSSTEKENSYWIDFESEK